MRLTLRTLLAYLDDILEPKQTKEIGEKIAESHFATSLINRIREVLRRRRLTAPTLTGPGSGLDPNTVAEYLDNTLAPEKVADVEKTCLESDIHLAEVAGCHQILTLVLGEPVEIVPESRERIYALTAPDAVVTLPRPSNAEMATKPPVAEQPAAAEPLEPVAARAAAVEPDDFRKGIPDYLRRPPLWKRMLPYVAGACALALVALMVLPPDANDETQVVDNPKSPPAVNLGAGPGEKMALPQQDEPDVDETVIADVAVEETVIEEEEPVTVEEPTADVQVAQSDVLEADDLEVSFDPPAPPDGEVEIANTLPGEVAGGTEEMPAKEDNLFPSELSLEPVVEDLATTTVPNVTAAPDRESADVELGPTLLPAGNDENKVAVVEPPPQPLEKVTANPPQARAPVSAQYQWFDGNQQGQAGIMLFHDPNEEGWRKLAPRSMIHPGDRVAVPDPYIASLRLSEGNTHLTLLPGNQNGSLVSLMNATEAGHCTIEVMRGRLVFRGNPKSTSPDNGPVEIGLKVGNELWQVKFLTPDAVWGLEITPRRPEGFEQPLGDNSFTGDLYVSSGTIQFFDGKQLTVIKEGPGWIPLTPGQRPTAGADDTAESSAPLSTIPNWLGPPQLKRKQLEHCRRFAREFDEVQPIEISLVGAVDHVDADIATLGVKCFALTENYEVLVKALSVSESEHVRRAAVDGLRTWLPTDPENGEKLKEALALNYHEENADVIYRLLWGIPKEDAEQLGPSLQLVKWMGDERVEIREMAFDEVRRLSDKQGTLGYHPADGTDQKRRRAIESWHNFVERNGGLQLKH